MNPIEIAGALVVSPVVAGIAALMLVGLAARTLLLRRRQNVGLGTAEHDKSHVTLTRAIRAHSNFAEYVPVALVCLVLLELQQRPGLLLWGLGALLIVGRILHAFGISREPEDYRFRVAGMVCTLTMLSVSGVTLLFR